MLQISFLAKTFQSLCLRKRVNFTSAFCESLADIILKVTQERRSHETYILSIEASRKFCRISWRFFYFQANLKYISVQLVCRFFPVFFNLFFVPHVLFYIFHLGNLLISNLGSENSPLLLRAYQLTSLLNLINSAYNHYFVSFIPCDKFFIRAIVLWPF